jgi:hypothetical protein
MSEPENVSHRMRTACAQPSRWMDAAGCDDLAANRGEFNLYARYFDGPLSKTYVRRLTWSRREPG